LVEVLIGLQGLVWKNFFFLLLADSIEQAKFVEGKEPQITIQWFHNGRQGILFLANNKN